MGFHPGDPNRADRGAGRSKRGRSDRAGMRVGDRTRGDAPVQAKRTVRTTAIALYGPGAGSALAINHPIADVERSPARYSRRRHLVGGANSAA